MVIVCVSSPPLLLHLSKGNIEDPSTLRNMKESRNPDVVRDWLNARVDEGLDEHTIKRMLRMTSEQLQEVGLKFQSIFPGSCFVSIIYCYFARLLRILRSSRLPSS